MIIAVLSVLAASAVLPAEAQSPPLPRKKDGGYEEIQKQIEETRAQSKTIEKDLKSAEKEAQKTKAELIKAADAVRNHEHVLQAVDEKIRDMEQEKISLEETLSRDYASMGELVLILTRIRRMPPESLIVRPGAPLQAAQTATLLRGTLGTIQKRAALLNEDLEKLVALNENLNEQRQQAIAQKSSLEARYKEISALSAKRDRMYKDINNGYRETEARLARLSHDAKSMRDLISRIEDDERTKNAAPARIRQAAAAKNLPDPGKARMPATGKITIAFGRKDAIGAASEGVTIESQPRALAVAPLGGTVRYAGEFKNYGQIAIIEHKKGYHSLIAGMNNVDVRPGQGLSAGEPVGRLPSASSRGGPPTLYYELRYKGKPVDPAISLPDLGS
ncbi:MAG: peptidoglycan DD-metalloendopeptidase family protein [Proteobacteria bacterium]|nr:peptidoglycan DD-metalloendopeptidase family protein [Pseudomonadota bacterium]